MACFLSAIRKACATAEIVSSNDKVPNTRLMEHPLLPKTIAKCLALPQTIKSGNVTDAADSQQIEIQKDDKGRKRFVKRRIKTDKPDTKKDDTGEKSNDKKNKKKEDKPAEDAKQNPDSLFPNQGKDWTAEDDEKLKSMKAENKTWKEITEVLGRPKHELAARYKELKEGDAQPGANAQKDKDKQDDKKDDNKTDKKGKQKANDQQQNNKPKQKAKQEDKSKAGSSAPRYTFQQMSQLMQISGLDIQDLMIIDEIMKGDEDNEEANKRSWTGISSRYFDQTNRRIDPGKLRRMFEPLGQHRRLRASA